MKSGRPLRFLGRILGGWVIARVALFGVPLLVAQSDRAPAAFAAIEEIFPIAEVASDSIDIVRSAGVRLGEVVAGLDFRPVSAIAAPFAGYAQVTGSGSFGTGLGGDASDHLLASSLGFVHAPRAGAQMDLARFAPGSVRNPPPEAGMALPAEAQPAEGRWRGSAWLLWRPAGDSMAAATGGQLGASQAGVRVDHAIARIGAGELGAYARVSAAVERPHAGEAAAGLAWRPSRSIPVTLAVERRQALSRGGRNDFAAYAAGGLGPTGLAHGLEVEGYGQAGFVDFADPDLFVDGKMSVMRRLTAAGARRDVAVGASISGGAQPGVSRLDIGPEVRFRLPLNKDRMRISAEWRERVAGDALPASGPTVTVTGEF